MMASEEYCVKFDDYVDIFIKRSAKSNHARLVQYRARKQAADRLGRRLLTRAVLYQCPNVAWLDLALVSPTALSLSDKSWLCYTNIDPVL